MSKRKVVYAKDYTLRATQSDLDNTYSVLCGDNVDIVKDQTFIDCLLILDDDISFADCVLINCTIHIMNGDNIKMNNCYIESITSCAIVFHKNK